MSIARALRLAPALAAMASAMIVAGCGAAHQETGSPHPPRLFTEHDHANGKTIHIAVGDKVVLILGSSYWNFRGSSTPMVLRQVGPAILVRSSHSCPPGVGCQPKRARYKALAPGKAVISAHRLTCGEALRCTGSHGHFRLTVIVR
ncbi:MAG: hypothetical protein LBV34_16415 [Nocardiopsaceae bacterium]|jgi:hypothetical protein|nr:hypothetical protein [Nocardiopsaceae bacterium]